MSQRAREIKRRKRDVLHALREKEVGQVYFSNHVVYFIFVSYNHRGYFCDLRTVSSFGVTVTTVQIHRVFLTQSFKEIGTTVPRYSQKFKAENYFYTTFNH